MAFYAMICSENVIFSQKYVDFFVIFHKKPTYVFGENFDCCQVLQITSTVCYNAFTILTTLEIIIMTINQHGQLTAIGEYTQHSLCHGAHVACATGILYTRIYTNEQHGALRQARERGGDLPDFTPESLPTTIAKLPVIGIVGAAIGIIAAAIELVASPIIILACLPFCWTETGYAGLRMGAHSFLSGSLLLLAYPLVVVFGNTIGWAWECSDYADFDKLLHG